MDIWTDGIDMPFARSASHDSAYERFCDDIPKVSRSGLARLSLRPGESPYAWKLTRDGEAYAKIHCGDYGYYRLWPTADKNLEQWREKYQKYG